MLGVLNIAFLIVFAFPHSKKNKTPSFENPGTRLYFPGRNVFHCYFVVAKNFDGLEIVSIEKRQNRRIIAMGPRVNEEAMMRGEIIRTTFRFAGL